MGHRQHRSIYWLTLAIAIVILGSGAPAVADDGTWNGTFNGSGGNYVTINGSVNNSAPATAPAGTPSTPSSASSTPSAPATPTVELLSAPEEPFPMATPWECMAVPTSLGADPAGMCDPPEPVDPADPVEPAVAAPPTPPQVTAGLVGEALRQVELPAPVIEVQPPNGRTLVNFETNFFTEPGGFNRTVTLLGQRVDLRIEAASYSWVFGDGQSLSTSSPGAAYPQLDVTHSYASAGGVEVRVDTTYVAQFSVNGGPYAPVPGSVTVAGAGEPLQVVEARPTLVG